MNHLPSYPIFYDPRQRRGLRFRRIAILVTVGLLSLFSVLIFSIFTNPTLPNLHLGGNGAQARLSQRSPQAPRVEELAASAVDVPKAIGFLVNWDAKSFTALKQHIFQIDKLIPEWLHLGADGKIEIDDLQHQQKVLAYVREYRPNLKIVPLINNFDRSTSSWDREQLSTMLASAKLRHQNINNLLEIGRASCRGRV